MYQTFDCIDADVGTGHCSPNGSGQSSASQPIASTAHPDDGRREARERTYKAARIGFGGGRAVTGCVVRNLSASGACLGVQNPADVPERFNLVFDSGEPSRMARVIWRSSTRIGVSFTD
jgi:ABC-type polysaccharide/polyol phosphate transport system ATPase subunit